jgi:integrase/recombinase XerD
MAEPKPDRVRVSGPLASFADGFCVHLVEQGYSLGSAQFHLQLLAHVSGWMEGEGLAVDELSPGVVERFLVERRHRGYASSISPRGLRPAAGLSGAADR